jgi:hypothetical protein
LSQPLDQLYSNRVLRLSQANTGQGPHLVGADHLERVRGSSGGIGRRGHLQHRQNRRTPSARARIAAGEAFHRTLGRTPPQLEAVGRRGQSDGPEGPTMRRRGGSCCCGGEESGSGGRGGRGRGRGGFVGGAGGAGARALTAEQPARAGRPPA